MKQLLVLISLAALWNGFHACDAPASDKCDSQLLQCCGLQLKNDLQLANCFGILAFEPECHRQEIEKMYTNGTDGLLFVCDAFNKYYECLGTARRDCLSIGFHIKSGLRLNDAIEVVSMYQQFGFACGAGFEGFSNNDLCMSQIFSSKQAQIQQCRNNFRNNVITDNRNHCLHFQEYTGCFTKLFDHSSCNVESSWWGCEYARQSGRVILHDCNLPCSSLN